MPTRGFADGIKIDLSRKVFKFVGTKRYDTALGSKTVFHLKYIRDHVPAPAISPELENPKAEYRTWTDTSGKYTIRAQFVGFEDGKVILQREDETVVRVSPSILSAADVKWYKDELKERNKRKLK